ncbi:ester cyclase [Nonomuraea sp. KC401]|uniref:ester cyclase n=1 Tax=unclassified Nonomuraea TaxID=2593643 RepID=UPI0010FEE0F2|nr:nuclear transport factor 2 family protein [Nonomuraea sp. KC401]NBE96845.1 ester cyclase [Nonomuraea sp. K271]TLF66489.1 ester cyclase [Nonomuraea sp. KC401]
MTTSSTVREARETLVRTHFESEAAQDFDVTMTTMLHPRYELIPTGEVFEGEEQVRGYYHRTRTAFPDQRHENVRLHHSDTAVIAEFDLLGTHLGELYGIPPTGRSFRCPVVAFFLFDGPDGDRIICERIYFNAATITGQLGISPTAAA